MGFINLKVIIFLTSLNQTLLTLVCLSGVSVLSLSPFAFLYHSSLAATAAWWLMGLVTLCITFLEIKNSHFHVHLKRHINWSQSWRLRHFQEFWLVFSTELKVGGDILEDVVDFHILFRFNYYEFWMLNGYKKG